MTQPGGRLDVAARKLTVGQLTTGGNTLLSGPGPRVVWVQGVVRQTGEGGTCTLQDDGASVVVSGIDRIPGSSQLKLTSGQYCMVVGELKYQSGGPQIVAMKVQDPSACPLAQKMWHIEVKDFQQHVAPL